MGSSDFLREDFGFATWFKQGQGYYYHRKSLLALARELKERKVNLARYIEYKGEKAKFEAKAKTALGKKKLGVYVLAADMKNIETSTTPKPNKVLATDELKSGHPIF